jgi:hypothetical protein
MEPTRRWFLIGTAATLVAPALPQIVRSEAALIRLSPRFDFRAINDFMFSTKYVPGAGLSHCRVFRPGSDFDVHKMMIGSGGMYRYVAFPGEEWTSTSAAPLVVEVDPAVGCNSICIVYNADRPSAEAIRREHGRVAACSSCRGAGYSKRKVVVVPTNGMDEWETEEDTDEPCQTCGGIDYRITRGRLFCESFQFGPNGEPPCEGYPCAFYPCDSDWKQAAD